MTTQTESLSQEEIISMAKEAGFPTDYNDKRLLHSIELEAFAKLVKEHCCSVIRDNIPRSGHDTKEYVFAFKLIDAIKRGQA